MPQKGEGHVLDFKLEPPLGGKCHGGSAAKGTIRKKSGDARPSPWPELLKEKRVECRLNSPKRWRKIPNTQGFLM